MTSQTQVPRLRWWLALVCAALGGYLLDLSAPSVAWWPAGFLGAVLTLTAVWQQRASMGFLFGLVAGACFWLPHISWLTLYLGPIPWLALSTVMIAWFGLFGACAAMITRGLHRLLSMRPHVRQVWIVAAQSVSVAGLWVAREQLQSAWPYGGFAWGRLSHGQADGPLVALVSWLGFAGFSGFIALACALLVAFAFVWRERGTLRTLASGVAVLLIVALCAVIPAASLQQNGTLRVAAVQGNSKSGIFDNRESGDVFRDHVDATVTLLDELESRDDAVEVIVWPENSGEFQLPDQHYRALEVQRLSARAGAPIVTGTILQDSESVFTNSSVVFDEHGATALRYDKRRPVPFAEYMPNRSFFHALVPDLVDLVQLDYAFGTRSAVLNITAASQEFAAGIAICFDIIFDDHAVAMMRDGANIVFAQTNNADFGRTDESAQQLQIARLRAVEMGRTLVNISTVGTSAIVLSDGHTAVSLEPFTADAMVADVPLYADSTPALRYGAAIAGTWMALAGVGLLFGVIGLRRRT